jgi:hypothetical protein
MTVRQRGMLLLPVAIMLAITGALAYTMTRQGAMSVAQVDRQYDLEAARYLAGAGLRLVKWQNEKESCTSAQKFTWSPLPGVAGTVTVTDLVVKSGEMTMTVVATGPLGSVSSARREKLKMYERKTLYEMTLPSTEGNDIFIKSGLPKQGGTGTLEARDGSAHPLIKFGLSKLVDHSRVARATLSVYQSAPASVQSQPSLSLHPLTRDWKDDDATWTFPWAAPGGDYVASPAATVPIGGIGTYSWRIDSLARAWIDGKTLNYGVLLKPYGLNGAKFESLESGSADKRPSILIHYYKRCA